MISRLRGIIIKGEPGQVTVDVNGVGYDVAVPVDVWEILSEETEQQLFIRTYVREDRFSLFGFSNTGTRALFDTLINISGIGPRIALEICAVSPALLHQAVVSQDVKLMTSIKGIGKKLAEKLLLELKNLTEKSPFLLQAAAAGKSNEAFSELDNDAISALQSLGYDQITIIETLRRLPGNLTTTEERVAAALKSF